MANSSPPSPSIPAESSPRQTTIDSSPHLHLLAVPPRQTTDLPLAVAVGPASSTRLDRWSRASLVALLVAPLVGIPPATRIVVDRYAPVLAHEATTALERAFAWRPVYSAPETESPPPLAAHSYETETFTEPSDDKPHDARTVASPGTPPKHRGVMVRADAVVRAVRSGGRPSSVPAPATGSRPAGLSLIGVSRYGTGLRDGDVLTNVGGTPATSEGMVIGIVAGAISQGARAITGVVWRGEQRIDVSVEIPAPEAFAKPQRQTSVDK